MALSIQTETIGTHLLACLQNYGIKHIFGVPGDYVLAFDKLIEKHSIEFVNATSENNAGYMADAYARLCGMGVACITYGVGLTIVNALSQAYLEGSPVVIISGTVGTDEFKKCHERHHLINSSYSFDLDTTQLEIFKKITVDQVVLNHPEKAEEEIKRVLESCWRLKKPVYIELPRNFVNAPIPLTNSFQATAQQAPDLDVLHEASQEIKSILLNCKQPVIWAGHEIQRFGLAPLLLKFAERFQIPIVSSLLGKTVICENHPLFMGVYQGDLSRPEVKQYVDSCDCEFTLGVILDDVGTGLFTAKLNHEKRIFANSSGLSINHHRYQNVALTDLLETLADLKLDKKYSLNYPANNRRKAGAFSVKSGERIKTERLFECLQSHLSPENMIVSDFGDCLFGSTDLILEENSFLSCAYFGSLGFGVPGAVGAAMALPERRVIGLVGDGAFQMTGMELSTAVRYHLDPVIIVLNNHGYATERPLLEGSYNDIQEWNYAEIPKILNGGIGIRARTEEELERAFQQAFSQRGVFYLIEVPVDKLDFSAALQRFAKLAQRPKFTSKEIY